MLLDMERSEKGRTQNVCSFNPSKNRYNFINMDKYRVKLNIKVVQVLSDPWWLKFLISIQFNLMLSKLCAARKFFLRCEKFLKIELVWKYF